MLPDFPKIKKRLKDKTNLHLKNIMNQNPLFSQIKVERHFEGDKIVAGTVDGEIDVSTHKEIESRIEVKREDIIAKGPMAFIEHIGAIAKQMDAQKEKMLFDKIKEVTDKTGNIVDGKGQPLTFDLFMKTLEKIQIDFDEQSNPYLPTLVVPPEIGAKIKDQLSEWESNPAYKELIEKKRKEWNDRESHRKLVD